MVIAAFLLKISREELMRDIEIHLMEPDDMDELFTLFNEIQSEPLDDSHTANYDDYCTIQTRAPGTSIDGRPKIT